MGASRLALLELVRRLASGALACVCRIPRSERLGPYGRTARNLETPPIERRLMSLANLSIDMTAKVASFEAELKRSTRIAEQQSAKMQAALGLASKALAGLGVGFSVTALAGFVRSTADVADEMSKLSRRAGITTEAMSELAYAASLADVDNQELARALRILGNDAAAGGEKLRRLGIDLLDANGRAKTSDQLFRDVADRIAGIEDPARRAAVASQLFGDRLGGQLIPLLDGGRVALEDAANEAHRFNRVISTEAGIAAEQFNDTLSKLTARLQGFGATLATPVITSLNAFFGSLERGLQRGSVASLARDVIRLNNDLEALEARRGRPFINQERLEENIRQTRAKLEEAKAIFLRAKQDFDNPPAPAVPVPFDPDKPEDNGGGQRPDRISAADRYLQALQRQLEATQNLTMQEALLRDISMGRLGQVTEAQQQELVNLAEQIDAARAQAQADEERLAIRNMLRQSIIDEAAAVDAANASWEALLQTIIADTTLEKTRRLNEQIQVLDEALKIGRISAEQYAEAMAKITERRDELDRTREAANRLNMSFTSAFEDAVVAGRKFQDVLNGIIQDIARMAFRRAVSEPLGNAMNAIVGRIFSFDGGGFTGNGPRAGGLDGKGGYLAMLHPQETVIDHTKGQSAGRSVVVHQEFNFNGPADQALVLTAAQMGAAMGRQAIYDDMARGRMG